MSGEVLCFVAGDEDADVRADVFLADRLDGYSRSAVQKLFEENRVTIGEDSVGKNRRLRPGEQIEVALPETVEQTLEPQDIFINVVYEDSDLAVVEKPKGMVVHPAPGNPDGTLVNTLLHRFPGQLSTVNGEQRPGILHRIDKDTSGLLLVAKNNRAHLALAEQIMAHSITRQYQTVVYGGFKSDEGWINAPIGRHPVDRKRMCVAAKGGREARTHYRVVSRYPGFTHLLVTLETGRTHQIRVHMAHVGHPVAGDPVYGPKKVITELRGQCLHACRLGFIHPTSGEYMEFDSPLPNYFTNFLSKIDK